MFTLYLTKKIYIYLPSYMMNMIIFIWIELSVPLEISKLSILV